MGGRGGEYNYVGLHEYIVGRNSMADRLLTDMAETTSFWYCNYEKLMRRPSPEYCP